MPTAVGYPRVDHAVADRDADSLTRQPPKQKHLGPATKDVRLDLRVVQVEQSAQNGHRQHPPPTAFGERTGDHTGDRGGPSGCGAPRVGGEEDDHA